MTQFKFIFIFLITAIFMTSACGPVKFSSGSNQPPATGDDGGANPNPDGDDDTGTAGNPQTRDVTTNFTVQAQANKVDILIIADNSSSMEVDNKKLGQRLSTFVANLESAQIDWQMCLVVTAPTTIDSVEYWGASVQWGLGTNGDPHSYNFMDNWILKRRQGINLSSILTYTMEKNLGTGGNLSNDERGIKSAYWHLYYKEYNGCYRPGAALAHIYISDEDVRSIGGRAAEQVYSGELKPLANDDLPATLVDLVKNKLGTDTRFRANSIIVKPGDSACLAEQNTQATKAHYGKYYEDLSKMTGGGVGSICDADYYNNLNFFNEVINDALDSMPLECNPVGNQVTTAFTPPRSGITTTVQGQSIVFSPSVPSGTTITASYKCNLAAPNRVPNAVESADSNSEMSIWTRLYNWIIQPILNLF